MAGDRHLLRADSVFAEPTLCGAHAACLQRDGTKDLGALADHDLGRTTANVNHSRRFARWVR